MLTREFRLPCSPHLHTKLPRQIDREILPVRRLEAVSSSTLHRDPLGCNESVSIALGFELGQAWKLRVHPSDQNSFLGCLLERLLASLDGE